MQKIQVIVFKCLICKFESNASYIIKSIAYTGDSLHFMTDCRKPGTAHLMFPHEDVNFRVFEFGSEFDKTPKNQRFSHFQLH